MTLNQVTMSVPELYHFYDSSNPLHDEFNTEVLNVIKTVKDDYGLTVISIDLNEIDTKECDPFIRLLTGKSIDKLKNRRKPRFYLKHNGAIKPLKSDNFRDIHKTATLLSGNLTFEKVSSVYSLAEALKSYNTRIDSQVVLVYIPMSEGDDTAQKFNQF